ncbi:MAG: DUF1731 domain-containing protein [Polyangiales bacterium]
MPRRLGACWGASSWLPVPGFALRLAVGEAADVVLTGQRAAPSALLASGYRFAFDDVEAALRAALGRR